MTTSSNLSDIQIPQPKPHFLLGNAGDLNAHAFVQSLMELAKQMGPIFRLQLPGSNMIVVSSQELVNELCDESRFEKQLSTVLENQRDNAGDGLFTARTDEPNWAIAHRILMPGFGQSMLKNFFPSMWDIAEQLLLKWERHGETTHIDVPDDMTRLTLDTLALCAFGYRFNSFYRSEPHPYVTAMTRSLKGSMERSQRPKFLTRLQILKSRQRNEDIRLMHEIGNQLIAERKKQLAESQPKDLLSLMLHGKDPKTGQQLSEENIGYQMVTFLTAGHETTSGLLSFAMYFLLEHPEVLRRVRQEVDNVIGHRSARFEDIASLTYLDQVLKETLRLWPTAPAFTLRPKDSETMLGGKYTVQRDDAILVLLPMLHRDPAVWPDAERFDPDRFAPNELEKLPPNCWKPFGNGARACIGRPMALQEAMLVLASIVQRFDLFKADPNYKLRIKETLTLKPDGFFITARRRDVKIDPVVDESPRVVEHTQTRSEKPIDLTPIHVLYGSNSGSCESFAQRIANDAARHGFAATLSTLDDVVDKMQDFQTVVIVTASYEGKPTDNAQRFVPWIKKLSMGSLSNLKYAVFGCGNKDWARTYQAIPRFIDTRLGKLGGTRITPRGEADARGDFFGDFDRWYESFWGNVADAIGASPQSASQERQLELEIVDSSKSTLLRQNSLQYGVITENRELVSSNSHPGYSKRHIAIALPKGASYRAGDYLSVLPTNSLEVVGRVLRRFDFAYDTRVVLKPSPGVQSYLPIGQPILAGELIASFVELNQPATRQQIEQLAVATRCPMQKQSLGGLAQDQATYVAQVLDKRLSVLDLLERHSSCELTFASFLQMLPCLKPRQYSISSSPMWSSDHCTLTIAVLQAQSLSGDGIYRGVASNYLANAQPGARIAVSVRPSQAGFHPPGQLETPIIMVCAGTGIAPFRAFLQERAIRAEAAEGMLGEALLFFGCKDPNVDFLYRDELEQWQKDGIVKLRAAFSDGDDKEVRYVQHRLWRDREEVLSLLDNDARIFVCGDGRQMAPAVRETFGKIYQSSKNCGDSDVEEWLSQLENSTRYSQDVFA